MDERSNKTKEMKKANWIPGYENRYKITQDGQVFSYKIKGKVKPLKAFTQMYDYHIINLRKDGESKTYLIHQLVMSAWGPPRPHPQNKHVIAHRDKNKNNNHVSNLEWRLKKNALGNKRIPLKVTGVDDGDVIYFRSMSDCATYFHTSVSYLRSKIREKKVWRGYNFEEYHKPQYNNQ